jgi:starch synthase
MPRILMAASEAVPFAKTGGLADVMGALPVALKASGEDVGVVVPRYRGVRLDGARRVFDGLQVHLGADAFPVNIHRLDHQGVPFFLVDSPALFDREGLYGDGKNDYPDNHIRFAVFAHAVLAVARHLFRPRIFHCHDWQAGLVPVLLKHALWGDPSFIGAKVLFTVHNLGYQGLFPRASMAEVGLDDSLFQSHAMEYYGQASFLKGALEMSDAISTVSPRYAEEIQTPELGFGLDELLRRRASALTGILNGVDYGTWNPETDPHIATHYSAANLEGKRAAKRDLLAAFGLPEQAMDKPLAGIVSRFVGQKGFDLIAAAADRLLSEDLYLVALGSGEAQYEKLFLDLAAARPERVGVRIGYDDPLAHKIEAGSDMFLMPSRYEPCGLNQFYSLRYGTIPVVRATGGLEDSIDDETGFKFTEYSGDALIEAIRRALTAFADRPRWEKMMRAGMGKDFSWNVSAAEYSALYRRLIG